MKIAIIGSRTFKKLYLVRNYLLEHANAGDIIISGGAIGPDTVAEETAESMCLTTMIFKPEYNKYGIQAPLIRNKTIVESAEFVIAFWDGKSTGTADAIDYARQIKKPLQVIYDHNTDGVFAGLFNK